MPQKIGKPAVKTPAEKQADEKLLEELQKEAAPDRVENDNYTDFNPLAAQAERLPTGIKGADGFEPNSHVSGVGGGYVDPSQKAAHEREDFNDDDDLGGGITDPDELTAD